MKALSWTNFALGLWLSSRRLSYSTAGSKRLFGMIRGWPFDSRILFSRALEIEK